MLKDFDSRSNQQGPLREIGVQGCREGRILPRSQSRPTGSGASNTLTPLRQWSIAIQRYCPGFHGGIPKVPIEGTPDVAGPGKIGRFRNPLREVPMSTGERSTVIKINAITVPEDAGDELARRFAARAGAVDDQEGFEGFELLRPTDDRRQWLVVTRWRDEAVLPAVGRLAGLRPRPRRRRPALASRRPRLGGVRAVVLRGGGRLAAFALTPAGPEPGRRPCPGVLAGAQRAVRP